MANLYLRPKNARNFENIRWVIEFQLVDHDVTRGSVVRHPCYRTTQVLNRDCVDHSARQPRSCWTTEKVFCLSDADGKYLESIRPPPLDAAVADYDDISADDELKEQARSSEPDKDGDSTKLPDQFASHLGLSKKKASPASSTPSHPFVNPRAAAFSSSHLWMEPTPFPVSSTLQPTSSTPSAMPPKPSKPGAV